MSGFRGVNTGDADRDGLANETSFLTGGSGFTFSAWWPGVEPVTEKGETRGMIEAEPICVANGYDSTHQDFAVSEYGWCDIFCIRYASKVAPPKHSRE